MSDGLGDSGFAKAGLADAEDVASFVDEPAVEEFLDDASFELGSCGEVEAVESVDGAEAGAFEAARDLALLSYIPLAPEQGEGEVGVGEAFAFGAAEQLGQSPGQGGISAN